jgi:hypothetical protein
LVKLYKSNSKARNLGTFEDLLAVLFSNQIDDSLFSRGNLNGSAVDLRIFSRPRLLELVPISFKDSINSSVTSFRRI